jgi:hypothetical protein
LELLQTPDVSPCPKRLKDAVLEHRRGSSLFATGLELPRSEGREAGLVINEERPLVIRMGERLPSTGGRRRSDGSILVRIREASRRLGKGT